MTRFALAALAALTSLALTAPAVAEDLVLASATIDPFEVSDQRCKEAGLDYCVSVQTPGVSVQRYINALGYLEDSVLRGNGWSREMLQTEIQVNKFFFVAAVGS